MRTAKTGHVMLKLTPRQAKLLYDVVDGAGDAGSCEGGLTPMELRGLEQILYKLLPFMLARKKAKA